jgi:hypothetical protein
MRGTLVVLKGTTLNRVRVAFIVLMLGAAALAACGGSSKPTARATSAPTITTIGTVDGCSIVPLDPNHPTAVPAHWDQMTTTQMKAAGWKSTCMSTLCVSGGTVGTVATPTTPTTSVCYPKRP